MKMDREKGPKNLSFGIQTCDMDYQLEQNSTQLYKEPTIRSDHLMLLLPDINTTAKVSKASQQI